MSEERFIPLNPAPTQYARMLVVLAQESTKPDVRKWAGEELVKLVASLCSEMEAENAKLREALKVRREEANRKHAYQLELEAENARLERAWLALQKRAAADKVVEMEFRIKELEECLEATGKS